MLCCFWKKWLSLFPVSKWALVQPSCITCYASETSFKHPGKSGGSKALLEIYMRKIRVSHQHIWQVDSGETLVKRAIRSLISTRFCRTFYSQQRLVAAERAPVELTNTFKFGEVQAVVKMVIKLHKSAVFSMRHISKILCIHACT